MKDKFPLSDFKKWRANFLQNPTLPSITHTAFIEKRDLEQLLVDMNAMGSDSVKLYFLRFEMNGLKPQKNQKLVKGKVPEGCTYVEAGNGMSQIAIAITPTKGFKIDPSTYIVSADDITEKEMITLVIPGGREDGPGGLNPPPSETKPNP